MKLFAQITNPFGICATILSSTSPANLASVWTVHSTWHTLTICLKCQSVFALLVRFDFNYVHIISIHFMPLFIHCSSTFHDLCSHELPGSWAMDRTPVECHAGDLRRHHLPGATRWRAMVSHGRSWYTWQIIVMMKPKILPHWYK